MKTAWFRQGDAGTVTDPPVNPDALALTTIEPAVPVDRTMARALPLKALRLVPLYDDVVSVGSPLSTPTNWPGPETENVSDVLAVGTKLPLASWMSAVMKARSLPSARMAPRSADRATFAAAPAVFTVSVATTLPPFVQSARSVPEAQGTVHLPRPDCARNSP